MASPREMVKCVMLVGLRWRCAASGWVERLGMCCLYIELLLLSRGSALIRFPGRRVRSENGDRYASTRVKNVKK